MIGRHGLRGPAHGRLSGGAVIHHRWQHCHALLIGQHDGPATPNTSDQRVGGTQVNPDRQPDLVWRRGLAGLLWPAIRGMTYQRLRDKGLQWPCPTQSHPGTPYLFKQGFLEQYP